MTPTKASIYEPLRNANGSIAWARYQIRANLLAEAHAQLAAAEIDIALAKVRINERIENERAKSRA